MVNALVVGIVLSVLSGAANERIDYSLTIAAQSDAAAQVQVTLSFIGEDDGDTIINLPDSWGGEERLFNSLSELTIVGQSTSLEQGENPAQRIVHHPSKARLSLSYRVVQDWPGVPVASGRNPFRPIIQAHYVHMFGRTIFAFPDVPRDSPVNVKIYAPESWTVASDLEHGDLDIDALYESILVAGDFRIQKRQIDDAELRIAVRGDWNFSDVGFADTVQRVIQANYNYWDDPSESFLVTLLPLKTENNFQSMGGTGLGDAFAFFASIYVDQIMLIQLLTHEHLHTWNPRRLGGSYEGKIEKRGYWFSEGFNDFLTQRVGVAADLWTARDSIDRWNEVLAEYASSPVVEAPNSNIVEGFWSDRNYQRLPYLRGMLFAAFADHRIRTETEGRMQLDDVLYAMNALGDELESAPR